MSSYDPPYRTTTILVFYSYKFFQHASLYNICLEEEPWLKKVHQTVANDELDKNDKTAWYVFLFGLRHYSKFNCL